MGKGDGDFAILKELKSTKEENNANLEEILKKEREVIQKEIREKLKAELETKNNSIIEELKIQHKKEIEERNKQISQTNSDLQDLKQRNNKANSRMKVYYQKLQRKKEIEIKYETEKAKRREIQNEFVDSMGKIRVFCRIRPLSSKETTNGQIESIHQLDDFSVGFEPNNVQKYDSVFGKNSTQDGIFSEMKQMVGSAIDGYNVCIFAYGATGSGKTHTILGTPEQEGICPRVLQEMFSKVEALEKNGAIVNIKCSMIELY